MTIVLALFLLYSVFLAAFAWWRPRPRKADHPAGLNFWIVLSLGLRLYLAGMGIRYAPDAVVTQQAPPRVDLRSLKYIGRLAWPRAATLLAPWFMAPLAAGVLALAIATGNAIWPAALLVPGIVQRLRPSGEPWRRVLAAGILYPVFLLLRLVAPWHALFRVTNVVPMAPPRLLPWADGHPGLSARRP